MGAGHSNDVLYLSVGCYPEGHLVPPAGGLSNSPGRNGPKKSDFFQRALSGLQPWRRFIRWGKQLRCPSQEDGLWLFQKLCPAGPNAFPDSGSPQDSREVP
jgi:hypothetical protein